MPIERYKGQPLPIVVRFPSDPLVPYNKSYSDITDVDMNLKIDLANDADDAYLQKLQSVSSGVTVDEENHRFIMNIGVADYMSLTAGQTYFLTLNIQVSGISEFIEMKIPDRVIKIKSDTNRS